MHMPVQIKSHISIHTCDGKKVWHVPDEFIVLSQGTKYIRLPKTKHHAFASLVMHGCNALPVHTKKCFTVADNIGYKKLLILRAKAQRLQEAQQELEDAKAGRLEKGRRSWKRTRVQGKFMKNCPKALQLLLDMPDGSQWAFRALGSPKATRDIYVEFDELVITRVIDFLQQNGWDQSLKRIRRDTDITEEVGEIEAINPSCESLTSKDDELCTDKISLTTALGSVGEPAIPEYNVNEGNARPEGYCGYKKLHDSHVLHNRRELWWCSSCGAYTCAVMGSGRKGFPKKLVKPCPKVLSYAGQVALRRIEEGLMPKDLLRERRVA